MITIGPVFEFVKYRDFCEIGLLDFFGLTGFDRIGTKKTNISVPLIFHNCIAKLFDVITSNKCLYAGVMILR